MPLHSLEDYPAPYINGFIVLPFLLALPVIGFFIFPPLAAAGGILAVILGSGMTVLEPNEARVITFFGNYKGTLKESGFLCTIPLTGKQRIPLRLINFDTEHLKVNDLNGSPIEIGAVIVWKVRDAAQAAFNVDNYKAFVANQSDMAVRTLAAAYPYDDETGKISLRGEMDEISEKLKSTLQEKLSVAGIVIEEARLSHLAYAQEIASAMLKRQQAVAVFQARRYMAENALSMIDDVIAHFSGKNGFALSDDKKAELINNLLVVMTSDKEAHPVISAGKTA